MSTVTQQFLDNTIDPDEFGHKQHVQVAYDLLREHEFLDATVRYVNGIRALAHRAGAPHKFHMTVTLAYLSMIAERMATTRHDGFEEFIHVNSDVLSKTALSAWYSTGQLDAPLSRQQFVLPQAG